MPAKTSGRFDGARAAFARVLELSSLEHDAGDGAPNGFLTTYPGPRHLASLLLAAYDAAAGAAVTKVPLPSGSDGKFWQAWLKHRASSMPFMWPNHRDAIEERFHEPGNSAVLVLPTGAGKTTVACLKIAGTLARGKSVVFIAPTHALVDQLTEDLQAIFPEDLVGSIVSSDFDRLFASGTSFEKIEVMTPERCLALLSYAPEAFEDVGLLVFDECHLLSPVSNLRRALDGMFCVLAFNSIAPEADFLFLSAMLENGDQFARWIEDLTGRSCVFADPLWKPSRQARGVVCYRRADIGNIQKDALDVQRKENQKAGKKAKHLRKPAEKELASMPYALFGLQHNWLKGSTPICTIKKISDSRVPLTGDLVASKIRLKPNVNKVAAHIAAAAARNGLKGIVFVSSKKSAVSTAREISGLLAEPAEPTADERERWAALYAELGGLEHSILAGPSGAVPHNASMIRLERDLAERMFRRSNGAQVIVATPTLAQGLNLPAHIAILAGDKRTDPDEGARQSLQAHEILNAAARAGRAGHLANGVVLLVPEAILQFKPGEKLNKNVVRRLHSILPEDDRCLPLTDPLQMILDRISESDLAHPDVEYALNRLSTAVAPEDADAETSTRFSVHKSFAAFMAREHEASEMFEKQISRLSELLDERSEDADAALTVLAAQSGASVPILKRLRQRLEDDVAVLPDTISGWSSWIIAWLAEDDEARLALLRRDQRAVLGAVGQKKDGPLTPDATRALEPGIAAWLSGAPHSVIERKLGGDPTKNVICPRSRELVTHVIPLGFSFVAGLVERTAKEIGKIADGSATPISVIECLATGVRRGFDSPPKLAFTDLKKGFMSRVQAHNAYLAEMGEEPAFSNTENYADVIDRIRAYLAFMSD